MKHRIRTFFGAALLLLLWLIPSAVESQTQREQAENELKRAAPNAGLAACSLITRADVKNATGRDPFVDPESVGQGGWMCNVGIGELKVYSGAKSSETWESTLKTFKMDKEPRTPAPGFGEQSYFLIQSRLTSPKTMSRSWSRSRASTRSFCHSTHPKASRPNRCDQRSNR